VNRLEATEVEKQTRPLLAWCALSGAMLLWSGSFIAMKVALTTFHPLFVMCVRMSCSFFLLLPFLRAFARATPYAGGDWRILGLLVFAEPCLFFLFEGYALRYTTASQAGLVTSLLPLLVGVSAFFFLNERLSAKAWIGFFLAVAGVAVLTLAGENTSAAPNPFFGNTLEFCAMFMACIYTLCVRRLVGYHPFFITAVQAGGGALFFIALFALLGNPLPDSFPPAEPLIALAFLSLTSVLAYSFYNIGIARLSASQAAAWTNLIPALTLIMGVLFLGESLTFVQSLALLPLLVGIVLSNEIKISLRKNCSKYH
jgi:drug/metabolite transporter (DMT)-like permease